MLLFLKAYLLLLRFDLFLKRGDFYGLYDKVRSCAPINRPSSSTTVAAVCSTVDEACIWYWKEVLCLQRSAVVAYLLKRQSVLAELVIGAQQVPFRAHAWVEVGGEVVNDKPYYREIYSVLERC